VGFLALTFFLGIIVGSVLSQAIGLFLSEDGTARQLLVDYRRFGFESVDLDLIVFEIKLGFLIHVNLMSVLGIFVVAQLLRWLR